MLSPPDAVPAHHSRHAATAVPPTAPRAVGLLAFHSRRGREAADPRAGAVLREESATGARWQLLGMSWGKEAGIELPPRQPDGHSGRWREWSAWSSIRTT